MAERDARDTLTAARDCNFELCIRDIYTFDGDRSRLTRWTEMTQALMNGEANIRLVRNEVTGGCTQGPVRG